MRKGREDFFLTEPASKPVGKDRHGIRRYRRNYKKLLIEWPHQILDAVYIENSGRLDEFESTSGWDIVVAEGRIYEPTKPNLTQSTRKKSRLSLLSRRLWISGSKQLGQGTPKSVRSCMPSVRVLDMALVEIITMEPAAELIANQKEGR